MTHIEFYKAVQVFSQHIIFFPMLTKQLNSEFLKLFSLYVIFFFVSFFVSYFLSLFLSSPCFPFLILVYCTFFPSSVITHERGNYAFCHFLVCWFVSLSLSLSQRLVSCCVSSVQVLSVDLQTLSLPALCL